MQHEDPGSLAEAFWLVARRLRHQSREALAPWGIAPSHLRALGVLLRHGPLRAGELAEHLHIAPRSATEVIDALAERGLVERRPDPADRRATQVAATEQGAELGRAVRAARAAEADRVFAALDETERAELARLLRKLAPG
ncbi:MarR family winged helix-turn-helix transcriptional regulator [Actinomycetospora cinnamomea]|uniref:DNA-binding MarR family transcriptional regulator n=1 Tax=Actinomycetospora cinnamomea TaxID=663609 RepID=A0A2U1EZQ6_9PSEU|nr:MarR family transcriptional regulator [Actinomycetospora cinnamomea]PVZ05417.1 DNA-binding MarR family transcriptional regulator [Actinomycetospora cinnamomea]